MITIPIVEKCPYTVAGTGVMRISHTVLGILAGAIYDKDEWIALLIGKRSANGLDIEVNDLRVPLQERSHATCELAKPEPLTPEIVGVVHSHHSMGAFFSPTDVDTLNTRFPSSLVVAQTRLGSSGPEQLLGFSYKAEGRGALPCGTTGVVGFKVVPFPLIPEWPETIEPGFGEPDVKIGLYDCPLVEKKRVGLTHNCKAACGVNATSSANSIFGIDSKKFLTEVQEKTQRGRHNWFVDTTQYTGKGKKKHGLRTIEDYDRWNNEEGGYLRHWGEGV